jgi:ribosomal protein S8
MVKLPPFVVQLQKAITHRNFAACCKNVRQSRGLVEALYKDNLISWYTTGGAHCPDASIIATHTQDELSRMGFITTSMPYKRRLWVGVKYRDDADKTPVMQHISKMRGMLTKESVQSLLQGQKIRNYEGLRQGELVYLNTPEGVMELREAAEKALTGGMLVRVSPHTRVEAAQLPFRSDFAEKRKDEESQAAKLASRSGSGRKPRSKKARQYKSRVQQSQAAKPPASSGFVQGYHRLFLPYERDPRKPPMWKQKINAARRWAWILRRVQILSEPGRGALELRKARQQRARHRKSKNAASLAAENLAMEIRSRREANSKG